MKLEENINEMQKQFIHIMNYMRTLGKAFQNEDLVVKVLIRLNCSWKPKVISIYESRDLSSRDLDTLFGKLHEYEIKLNRIDNHEESDKKKKKSISLKVADIKDMVSKDEDCQSTSNVYMKSLFFKNQGVPKAQKTNFKVPKAKWRKFIIQSNMISMRKQRVHKTELSWKPKPGKKPELKKIQETSNES